MLKKKNLYLLMIIGKNEETTSATTTIRMGGRGIARMLTSSFSFPYYNCYNCDLYRECECYPTTRNASAEVEEN
jgi:hypothetical protein